MTMAISEGIRQQVTMENHPPDVLSAFELLLGEIEAEIEFINGAGAKAFESRDYQTAREALEHAASLAAFHERAALLRTGWQQLPAPGAAAEDEKTASVRRNLGRLRRGRRTEEAAYYRPILEVLAEMGGSGRVADVLERVAAKMRAVLKPVDYQPLASRRDNPRWRNSAQWARNAMVQEGLLDAIAPRGIWRISEKGRIFLKAP